MEEETTSVETTTASMLRGGMIEVLNSLLISDSKGSRMPFGVLEVEKYV